jgi:hypothetical protein
MTIRVSGTGSPELDGTYECPQWRYEFEGEWWVSPCLYVFDNRVYEGNVPVSGVKVVAAIDSTKVRFGFVYVTSSPYASWPGGDCKANIPGIWVENYNGVKWEVLSCD